MASIETEKEEETVNGTKTRQNGTARPLQSTNPGSPTSAVLHLEN